MADNNNKNTNGPTKREKISFSILLVLLTGIIAYFTAQTTIAEKFADRPTRMELAAAVKEQRNEHKQDLREVQEQTQRQLDDIKKQQEKAYSKTESLDNKIDKILYELRLNRR